MMGLILTFDAEHAQFYTRHGFKVEKLIKEFMFDRKHHRNPSQDLKNGRFRKQSTPIGFFDPHTDSHEVDVRNFVRQVFDQLTELTRSWDIQKVHVFAEPKALGEFRKLKDKLTSSVRFIEVPKNLIKLPVDQIEKTLEDCGV